MTPLTNREYPRSRNQSRNQMYEILQYDQSFDEDRDRSKSKVAESSLFRSGSSLSTTKKGQRREVINTKIGNMKGAVVMGFGDSVRAENQKRVGLEA